MEALNVREKNNSFRLIRYIPYVSNYGFVPQTLQPTDQGGDGDPIDVILIGERFDRGSIIKSKILGVLKMKDEGMIDNKIIAIPLEQLRDSSQIY